MLHMKFVTFGPVVSEVKSFESVDKRRTEASHTKSSPGTFGLGELKMRGLLMLKGVYMKKD